MKEPRFFGGKLKKKVVKNTQLEDHLLPEYLYFYDKLKSNEMKNKYLRRKTNLILLVVSPRFTI